MPPEQPSEEHEVLPAAEQFVDGRVLAGQCDPFADQAGLPRHVGAGHLRAAGVESEQGRQHPHGGGLAGPVRPEEAVHDAGRYVEAEPVERDGPVSAPISFAQLFGHDRRCHGARVPRSADGARTGR
jgi:hypothetical protein